MNEILSFIINKSLSTGLLVLIVVVLLSLLGKFISPKSRYICWIIVMVVALVPVDFFQKYNKPITESNVAIQSIKKQTSSITSSDKQVSVLNNKKSLKKIDNSENNFIVNNYLSIIIGIYSIVTVVIIIGKYLNYKKFIKHLKYLGNYSTDKYEEVLKRIKLELNIKSDKIKIIEVARMPSPIYTGFSKPKIIIPQLEYSESEIYFVLKHECIHYKRNDLWIKFLGQMLISIYWFNPLTYLMVKKIDEECENSCDQVVMSNLMSEQRRAYAHTIIDLFNKTKQIAPVYANSFYGGKSNMKKRISSIIEYSKSKKTLSAAMVAVILGVSISAGNMFLDVKADTNATKDTKTYSDKRIGNNLSESEKAEKELLENKKREEKIEKDMSKLAKKAIMKRYSISSKKLDSLVVESFESRETVVNKDKLLKENLSGKEYADLLAKEQTKYDVFFYSKKYNQYSKNDAYYASVSFDKKRVLKTMKNEELKVLGSNLTTKKAKPTKKDISSVEALKAAKKDLVTKQGVSKKDLKRFGDGLSCEFVVDITGRTYWVIDFQVIENDLLVEELEAFLSKVDSKTKEIINSRIHGLG